MLMFYHCVTQMLEFLSSSIKKYQYLQFTSRMPAWNSGEQGSSFDQTEFFFFSYINECQ